MMIQVYLFVFILGAIIGSFLNVVILRYNTGESIFLTSSRCFSCGRKLRWHELVPILSFFVQKGKCKQCKAKISWQYPVVETITGLLFVLIFNFSAKGGSAFGGLLSTFYFLTIFSLLMIITVYDFRHQIIPQGFAYSFIVLSLFSPFATSYKLQATSYLNHILTGLGLFAFFALLWLISKGTWMGLGDAKLAMGIGFLLGPARGISATLFSFWIGAIFGLLLLGGPWFINRKRGRAGGQYNMKSKIPFAPFLVLGTLISFLLSSNVIGLYLWR